MKKVAKQSLKLVTTMLLVVVLLLVGALTAISIPAVQSRTVDYAREVLERQLGVPVHIESVDVGLPNKALLNGVELYDDRTQLLARIEQVKLDVVSFSLLDLMRKGESPALFVRYLELVEPEFHLRRRTDSTQNLDFLKKEPKENKEGRPLHMEFPEVRIKGGMFTYVDSLRLRKDTLAPGHMDYTDLSFGKIDAHIAFEWFPSGRMEVLLKKLSTMELNSGLTVDHIHTYFVSDTLQYTLDNEACEIESYVEFNDIELDAYDTRLRADMRFPGSTAGQVFKRWLNQDFEMRLKGSKLDFTTINYFSPREIPLEGLVVAQGDIYGHLNRMVSEDFRATFGDSTQVRANVILSHLKDGKPLDLDIRLERSNLIPWDLQRLLPKVKFPPLFANLGPVQIRKASFIGKPTDFVIDADLRPKSGELSGVVQMQLPPESPLITYSGFVRSTEINLNELGLQNYFPSERLNFRGRVNGKGVNLATLNTSFDAEILYSDVLGRSLDTLYANVKVAERIMKGSLALDDREGHADLTVDLDMSESPGKYKIEGEVRDLSLQKYLRYKDSVWVTSTVSIDLVGDSLDNMNGELKLADTRFLRACDELEITVPQFRLQLYDNTTDAKYVRLESSLLEADISGNFSYKKATQLTERLLKESRLYIVNNDSLIQEYYTQKAIDSARVNVQFAVATRDSVNHLFRFFNEPMHVSPGALMIGDMKFGRTEQANLNVKLDSLSYKEFGLSQGDVHLNLIKRANENSLLLAGGVEAHSLHAGPKVTLEKFALNLDGLDRIINSDLYAEQQNSDNRVQLLTTTSFKDDGELIITVDSARTRLFFQGDTLRMLNQNVITFFSTENRWRVQDFLVRGKRGSLSIEGEAAKDRESTLLVNLQQFDLKHIDELYPLLYHPEGMLDVKVSLTDVFRQPQIRVNGNIQEFELEEFAYGDIYLSGAWDELNKQIGLRASLFDQQDTTLALYGNYQIGDTLSPLDFHIVTRNTFPLNYVTPFVKQQLYDISGAVALESFNISGNFEDLVVEGTGHFEKAKFGIDYFKTEYRFDGAIRFDEDRITFDEITLFDQNNHTADFHGVIRHRGMREFDFDLQLDEMRDFLVVNTKKKDNELFYGTVIVKNGVAAITGDLEQLNIQAFAMSGAGSHLRIPVSDEDNLQKPDFIQFVGEDGSLNRKVNTGLQGFELNLELVATPEAKVDLIFDEKLGDIITGRGEGAMTLKIDEQGDFSMFGSYEIREGDYLFTAQNFWTKKFDVKSGGTIQWSGDPYDADLDLAAAYRVNADIKDLVNADQSIRVPVNVLMRMKGSLLQPDISLDIELPNLRQQEAAQLVSQLKTIQYDEQELNKQVFSLMVFSRFAPLGGFFENNVANTGVTTSVSELISNQLNYWLSQAINEDLSVNVGTTNFQDVTLLVSAKLFNDRVTIERDGTLVSSTGNGITVGNIRVIIRLSKGDDNVNALNERPGELVLEVFNRENLDLSFQYTNQTGMGLFFKKDFDNLRDLLGRSGNKGASTAKGN